MQTPLQLVVVVVAMSEWEREIPSGVNIGHCHKPTRRHFEERRVQNWDTRTKMM
jgi:hypothetical protein